MSWLQGQGPIAGMAVVLALFASKGANAQVIGVANGGREILRVDRSGAGGAIRIAPSGELQQQEQRDYFQRAIRLSPGGVDVSPVELNRGRDGVIDNPPLPVLRVATSWPSASTTPGISSTPSISSINAARCPALTGAKPTPQLPNMAVVTPCQQDGAISGSHIACPS